MAMRLDDKESFCRCQFGQENFGHNVGEITCLR